jgi:hypothetical protein
VAFVARLQRKIVMAIQLQILKQRRGLALCTVAPDDTPALPNRRFHIVRLHLEGGLVCAAQAIDVVFFGADYHPYTAAGVLATSRALTRRYAETTFYKLAGPPRHTRIALPTLEEVAMPPANEP